MNPFRPTFGKSPPLLVGRDVLVDEFARGLDEGPGAPERSTLYTGARGTGKTVMLNAVEDAARQRGWWVVSETPRRGLVQRLTTDHLPRVLDEVDPNAAESKLTGIEAPLNLGGLAWDTSRRHQALPSLRWQLGLVAATMTDRGSGVLLTIDELQGGDQHELREVADVIQHMFREDRDVAFAASGLPAAVELRLLQDDSITFLRRAERHHLGGLSDLDAADALRIPIEEAGRQITDAALDAAVELAGGYPYMVQVVGHIVWRQHPDREIIDIDDIDAARPRAIERIGRLVHEPSLADLSKRDRDLLAAMALDDGPSTMSDLIGRLGVDKNYANQYRLRLLATELVESPSRGLLDFALPYLRDYVRELDIPLEPDARPSRDD